MKPAEQPIEWHYADNETFFLHSQIKPQRAFRALEYFPEEPSCFKWSRTLCPTPTDAVCTTVIVFSINIMTGLGRGCGICLDKGSFMRELRLSKGWLRWGLWLFPSLQRLISSSESPCGNCYALVNRRAVRQLRAVLNIGPGNYGSKGQTACSTAVFGPWQLYCI